MNTMSIVEKWS